MQISVRSFPGPVPAALVLVAAIAASSGCGDDPVSTGPFNPSVVAVTAPDTLPAGQPLDLKIHWFSTNTCDELTEFSIYQSDDSTYTLLARGQALLGVGCDPRANNVVEAFYRLENPPQTRFYVEVVGANERFVHRVEVGPTPAAIERHRVSVRTVPPGHPANGAIATFLGVAGDTLGTAVTGPDGTAEIVLPCAPGGTRVYRVDVLGEFGRRVLLQYDAGPARCGLPEVLSVNV